MIYTSYFAKLNRLPSECVPIAICAKAPHFYAGLEYRKLAPSYDILMNFKYDHDEIQYTHRFNHEILAYLDADEVVRDLIHAANLTGKMNTRSKIVLLCYEKSGDFCHRHLVADWLCRNGHWCTEFKQFR